MARALGWPLAHPDHPDIPVTAGMVAAHCAGLSDAGGYLLPPDGDLKAWCARRDAWGFAPGTTLSYANLGSHLLALAAERATGRSFGELARDWLAARGIPGGFNWWGVPPRDRARAVPGMRPGAAIPGMRPMGAVQIDGDVPPSGFTGPMGEAMAPPAPCAAPWLWSPQGGLRTSLAGCLRLAECLPGLDATPIWRRGQGAVDGPVSVYQSWGFHLQLLDGAPHWPYPLIGHFADAHGIRGGIWHEPARGIAFAYLLNGVAERTGPEADGFSPDECAVLAALAEKATENAQP